MLYALGMRAWNRVGILLGFFTLFLASGPHAKADTWNGRIFEVRSRMEISRARYVKQLSSFPVIVLGEDHYSEAVQAVQALTIREVVLATGKTGAFTTHWEFLNATSQEQTASLFERLRSKQITPAEFFQATLGSVPSLSYAPILENTAELGGKLLGVNLSRAEKAPVVEHGITALDPSLLPPGFDYGSEGYFERFRDIMAEHASPEQLQNYYAAQCVVDDVMAYHLLNDSGDTLKFLIAGGFHTEYYDGVVRRLFMRAPRVRVASIRIFDASHFEEKELSGLLPLHDERYGNIADFVYFVNEPKKAN